MKKLMVTICAMFLIFGIAASVSAAPIDLSSWSELTLNFPGGQNAGNWVLGSLNKIGR